MNADSNRAGKGVLILGGGLTGLTAGLVLSRAGERVEVFERDSVVGGLSKTICHEGFRFDLGGHRFFTTDRAIDVFVKDLMGDELISVDRKSTIFMRDRYFDYPLKPLNALFGLGLPTTLKIIADYAAEMFAGRFRRSPIVSLEDWVVSRFGRAMFDIYFREYSEKVWGIPCGEISAEWVSQRIRGLSLATAIRNAFFRLKGRELPTLVDRFTYPRLGIGRISDRLKEEIEQRNRVWTGAAVRRINHSGARIESLDISCPEGARLVRGSSFISTIPVTTLLSLLQPPPPRRIMEEASRLRFRDLVVVAVMVDRPRLTDQTWIYIPEKRIRLGRLHEPTNWSSAMAPPGKTLMVAEYFSTRGDRIWTEDDAELSAGTVADLEALGFLSRAEVSGSAVVRVPNAYPLFEVGYQERCEEIYAYLARFRNLSCSGRNGMFKYYNMDHAIESGMKTAWEILAGRRAGGGGACEPAIAGNDRCDAA